MESMIVDIINYGIEHHNHVTVFKDSMDQIVIQKFVKIIVQIVDNVIMELVFALQIFQV